MDEGSVVRGNDRGRDAGLPACPRGLEAADVLRHGPRGKSRFITRVNLFNFGRDQGPAESGQGFGGRLQAPRHHPKHEGIRLYELLPTAWNARPSMMADALSRVVGVRFPILPMPLIRTIRPRMMAAAAAAAVTVQVRQP